MEPVDAPEPPEIARHEELDRALRLLASGRSPDLVAEMLSRRLTNRLMHAPLVAIYEAASARS